jgi:thiol-disulfide isomerase/thioredoxin
MHTTDESAGLESVQKTRSTPAIVPLLLAGLFMVTGICVLLVIGKEKSRIIGQTIIELEFRPLLNTESPITEESMRGKVVVLHFWGYWSPDCVKELPGFVKTQKSYEADAEVVFANVSCSQRKEETLDDLKLSTNKLMQSAEGKDLPTYYDPVEFSRTRLSQLLVGGFSYPTTLVIDGAGAVVDVWRTGVPPRS